MFTASGVGKIIAIKATLSGAEGGCQAECGSAAAMAAAAVVNALTCADLVLAGVKSIIPFDEVVEAMYKVGKALPFEFRETALGGIAMTETGQRIKKEIFGE